MMVTDRRRFGGSGTTVPSVVDAVARAARAGVDLIQVRERDLEDRDLLALTVQIRDATADTPARILINDRVDVALAADIDGVHLPSAAVSAARVRTMVPDDFLVGRSVHSVEEAAAAEREGGCDYLIFGSVYESASKPSGHVPAGVDTLTRVCARVQLPVLAIGGITWSHVADVTKAGAAGVAAIGLFAHADEAELREALRGARISFAAR
jgi:thiamine-phosphate pyrophosphorylase